MSVQFGFLLFFAHRPGCITAVGPLPGQHRAGHGRLVSTSMRASWTGKLGLGSYTTGHPVQLELRATMNTCLVGVPWGISPTAGTPVQRKKLFVVYLQFKVN